ncbi:MULTISPECIES: DUF6318 family protein [unclassified Nocardioides]|uniref:DUF6318 family protein n=1 Tax=unclassified Nocardioides TaxID=2615069 RepID=UPI0030154CE9
MGRLLPAALAVGLVLLAGCSGDDDPEPKISPTDSSSVASTPTPSPTPSGPVEPTLPAEAEGEDAAAAEAFVRFYWEMVNYAEATGEVEGLAALALQTCVACEGGSADIKRIYEAGGSVSGGEIKVRGTKSAPFESGPSRGFAVTVDVTIAPQVVKVPGEKVQRYSGGPNQFRFIVQRDSGVWLVGRWDPTS